MMMTTKKMASAKRECFKERIPMDFDGNDESQPLFQTSETAAEVDEIARETPPTSALKADSTMGKERGNAVNKIAVKKITVKKIALKKITAVFCSWQYLMRLCD